MFITCSLLVSYLEERDNGEEKLPDLRFSQEWQEFSVHSWNTRSVEKRFPLSNSTCKGFEAAEMGSSCTGEASHSMAGV